MRSTFLSKKSYQFGCHCERLIIFFDNLIKKSIMVKLLNGSKRFLEICIGSLLFHELDKISII